MDEALGSVVRDGSAVISGVAADNCWVYLHQLIYFNVKKTCFIRVEYKMPGCAVQNCIDCSRKIGSAVTYHRFPNDLVTRKNWIFVYKRKDVLKAETSRVSFISLKTITREIFKVNSRGYKENEPWEQTREFPERSERLKNRTVKRKLVSDT
ncbi:hypothetical protein PR048_007540 [Dryococelus australis]|uniref:Uncharacterized protein n=1 Tax=Dryococelus australis TaxID=614101 RepID=A0ABQ9HVF1_9NEOP|nr:hypothetical protein PR048_007540 [Dryococelus australis]